MSEQLTVKSVTVFVTVSRSLKENCMSKSVKLRVQPKTVTGVECPACSHTRHEATHLVSVYRCSKCQAVHGSCYLGDSYTIVLPYFHQGPDPDPKDWRYYDLECLGSAGLQRRHGWYLPATKRILQVG